MSELNSNSEQKIANNIWERPEDLPRIIGHLLDIFDPRKRPRWLKAPEFKYFSVKIDSRDGHFIILDRDGKRVTLEEFEKKRSSQE